MSEVVRAAFEHRNILEANDPIVQGDPLVDEDEMLDHETSGGS